MKVTLHNLYIKCKSILFTINSMNTKIIIQHHHQQLTDVTLEFMYLCTYVFPLPQLLHVYDLNAQQLLLKILYNSLKQLYLIKGMLLRRDRISPKSRTDHHDLTPWHRYSSYHLRRPNWNPANMKMHTQIIDCYMVTFVCIIHVNSFHIPFGILPVKQLL